MKIIEKKGQLIQIHLFSGRKINRVKNLKAVLALLL